MKLAAAHRTARVFRSHQFPDFAAGAGACRCNRPRAERSRNAAAPPRLPRKPVIGGKLAGREFLSTRTGQSRSIRLSDAGALCRSRRPENSSAPEGGSACQGEIFEIARTALLDGSLASDAVSADQIDSASFTARAHRQCRSSIPAERASRCRPDSWKRHPRLCESRSRLCNS